MRLLSFFCYEYNPAKPYQIATIQDENYRTEGDENKDKITNEHAINTFVYAGIVYQMATASRDKPNKINLNKE